MASKLFAFSRPLPAPFSGTRSKKVAVSSKYGDGTEATLTGHRTERRTRLLWL